MSLIIASAQYPITFYQKFEDWKIHTENWVRSAVNQHAELLLFPEYGSMELVSLFSDEIRNDIRKQVIEMDSLKLDFCKTFEELSIKYYATPDKKLPEDGIVGIQKVETQGWLIKRLDFKLIEEVKKDGQVFNFTDTQKIKTEYLLENISLKKIKF